MADSANIKISVAGQDVGVKAFQDLQTAVKALDYAFRQEKISALGLKDGINQVEAAARQLTLTQKQQVDLNAQIFQVNQRATFGFSSLSKSIHDATQASNRSQQAFVALAYIIQDLPYGIRGVANNLTQLTQILGAPIGINLFISAITSAAVVMDGAKKKADNLIESIVELKAKLGDIGPESQIKLLQLDLRTREREYADMGKKYTTTQFSFNPLNPSQAGFKTYVDRFAPEMMAKEKEILEIRNQIKEIEKIIADAKKRSAKDAEAEERATLKRLDAEFKYRVWYRQFMSETTQFGSLRGYGIKNIYGGQQKVGGVSGVTIPESPEEGISKDFRFYDNMFFDPMRQGFNDLNSIIRNQLFGTLDELRQKFGLIGASIIQSLQAVIAKLIETAIMTTVLSAVTGGNWGAIFSFLGSGGSGGQVMSALGIGGRSFAGVSPKTVNQIATGSSMANTMRVVGETRISGNDILVVYRNANATDIRRNA